MNLNPDSDVPDQLILQSFYSFESGEHTLISSSGEIMQIKGRGDVVLIGCIRDGIVASSWSPSGDLLALITGRDALLVMSSKEHEVLAETTVESDENTHPANVFVNVGWGKKETQFHGSAGKTAAQADTQVFMRPAEGDQQLPIISWRGDGQLFAVSHVDEASSARRIRIFDRSGTLQAISEPVSVLEWALAWQRSGALIASTALHPDGRRQVVFFERNGLRHGEFFLPRSEAVQSLGWSSDSAVLSVIYQDGVVELWTRQNYHWYLKQRLSSRYAQFQWGPVGLRALGITLDRRLEIIEVAWTCARSWIEETDKLTLVAVIDGPKLLLTPFAIANVAPPESLSVWNSEGGIIPTQVAIRSDPNASSFVMAVALEDSVQVMRGTFSGLDCSFSAIGRLSYDYPVQKVVLNSDYLLVQLENAHVGIYSHQLELYSMVECPIETVLSNCGSSVQTFEGLLLSLNNLENTQLVNRRGFSTQLGCMRGHFIGLCNGYIGLDGEDLVSGVAYLHHTPEFVILCMAADQTLRFLPKVMDPMDWPALLKGSSGEESMRRIEAGSEIVVCSPSSASLVLQAPRGNLETIYPRALVLASVRKALSALVYGKAYADCRRHRIDLNILYDVAPETFLATADRFVDQVKGVDRLNLFVASLKSENTAVTKYPGFLVEATKSEAGADKVNTVCKRIRQVLLSRPDSDAYLETVMTTYACQQPPQLEAALNAIIGLCKGATEDNAEVLDRALTYLIFLVDAPRLYDVALGMYHLPLALSIARRSQKDPKEYLPFLEELAGLSSEAMRRFRIDAVIGRYASALKHYWEALSAGPSEELSFEGFLEYMQQHGLYTTAMGLLKSDSGRLARVYDLFAQAQMSAGDHVAAATLYKLADNNKGALDACLQAGLWQQAIDISKAMEESERTSIITSLFGILMDQRKYSEAYSFALAHMPSRPDAALDAALAGSLWLEALCIPSVDKDFVLEEAVKAADHLESDMDDIRTAFEEKSARLILLQNQLLNPSVSGEGIVEISDALSEMTFRSAGTTLLTRSTALSGTTSVRNRKRAERKMMKARPGTPFERDGLRLIITELIERVKKIQESVRPLLTILSEHGEMNQAAAIQATLLDLIGIIARLSTDFHLIQAKIELKYAQERNAATLPAEYITNAVVGEEIEAQHAWHQAFKLSSEFTKNSWTLPFLQ